MTDEAIDTAELEREEARVGKPWRHRIETYTTTVFKGERRMWQVRDELDEPLFATRPDTGAMPEDEWQRLGDATRFAALLRNAAPELLRRARRLKRVEAFLREHGGLVLRALAIRGATHSLYARDKNAAAPEDAAHHALAALMNEVEK